MIRLDTSRWRGIGGGRGGGKVDGLKISIITNFKTKKGQLAESHCSLDMNQQTIHKIDEKIKC